MTCSDNTENNTNCSALDSIIKEVKRDFQHMLIKRQELVLKLGNAFEGVVSDPESICEEIKNTLKEEIAAKLISARNIEIYCPDKWKRKTRPKNEENSFSRIQEQEDKENKEKTPVKPIAIDTQGVALDEESTPVNSADAKTKDNVQEIEKHDKKDNAINKKELVDITTFPQYQEILIQNNELKEALEKATQLVQANKLHDNSSIDFEFSLPYGDVQNRVSSMLNVENTDKIWFNGRFDKKTGRVISANLGRIKQEQEQSESTEMGLLFLPDNLTKLMRQFQSTDFILKHNGFEVTSVKPARKEEMSAVATPAAACLSQTGISGNNNQIQQQLQDDSSTIHQ